MILDLQGLWYDHRLACLILRYRHITCYRCFLKLILSNKSRNLSAYQFLTAQLWILTPIKKLMLYAPLIIVERWNLMARTSL